MDMTTVYSAITKTAPQADGSLLVYGKATGSDLDLDEQRCDSEWLRKAMPEWFRGPYGGNVREQHDPRRAVGKATEHEITDVGDHMITARIVDPVAKAKIEAGVLSGFSIGIRNPRVEKSADARGGKITSGQVCELSIVDRPCLPTASLVICKSATPGWSGSPADLDEERGLVKCEELTVDKAVEAPAEVVEVAVVKTAAVDASVEATEVEKTAAVDAPVVPEFDRDAAKALVEATLAKAAADGLGQDESGDISGADQAIAIIAQLVISEAQDLAKMPAQGCDIHLLMRAVEALRCFSAREQAEQSGVDPDLAPIYMAADADVTKAKYSAEQLARMLKDGKAMRNADGDPSYPIGDKEDLSNAIHAVGRGKADHSAIRAFIVKRAKALGASDMIPENWSSGGASKAAEAEVHVHLDGQEMTKVVEAAAGESLEAVKDAVSVPAETNKAVVSAPTADPDVLIKAFTGALEQEDSPLRKMFVGIVEASTETTAKSLSALGERLVKVEQMATPGGPVLRRTEVERVNARKSDLANEAARYKMLATVAEDPDLRKGYTAKAVQLDAEVKALAA